MSLKTRDFKGALSRGFCGFLVQTILKLMIVLKYKITKVWKRIFERAVSKNNSLFTILTQLTGYIVFPLS